MPNFLTTESERKSSAVKKLKDSGHAIYENLTKQRAELYKLAKNIGGNRNVWTRDGIIYSVNHEKKVFRVNTRADLENIKPSSKTLIKQGCTVK